MSCGDDSERLLASLGTSFERDRRRDTVRITTADGTEIEVPGPDFRESLDWINVQQASLLSGPYGELLDRARAGLSEIEGRVRREEGAAQAQLDELLTETSGDSRSKLAQEARFRTYSLARLAAERARSVVLQDPPRALTLAELGRHLASQLDPLAYGGSQIRNLQAYAEAVYGNSLRVVGDLRGAVAAFAIAQDYLALGGGDPSEELEIDDLETSLWRSLRDFPRALELSERVIEGNLALGQTDAAARALHQRSMILEEMDEPEEAIHVLRTASQLATGSDDRFLVLTIRHGLAICLARIGRVGESGALLHDNQDLYRQLSSPKLDGCRLWLEGLIALGSDDLDAAVEALGRSRETFEHHGFPYDTAQVSLDLAVALAGLGRAAEVAELAAATYAFMESREVHPDALAALAVFRQAAAHESLNRELLRGLAQRLDRAATLPPHPVS